MASARGEGDQMKSLMKRICGLPVLASQSQKWHETLDWGSPDLMKAYLETKPDGAAGEAPAPEPLPQQHSAIRIGDRNPRG